MVISGVGNSNPKTSHFPSCPPASQTKLLSRPAISQGWQAHRVCDRQRRAPEQARKSHDAENGTLVPLLCSSGSAVAAQKTGPNRPPRFPSSARCDQSSRSLFHHTCLRRSGVSGVIPQSGSTHVLANRGTRFIGSLQPKTVDQLGHNYTVLARRVNRRAESRFLVTNESTGQPPTSAFL